MRFSHAAMIVGLLACVAPAAGATRKKPLPLGGELRLPLADPVVTAQIGAATLRLRVDFDQRDAIELNPDAVTRLAIPFEQAGDAEIGRVRLPGRMAIARMTVAGQEADIQLATHDRDCCEGVDGAIGVSLLPFELVRLTGDDPAPLPAERSFQMNYSKEAGLEVPQQTDAGAVTVQFSLHRSGVVATKAAGTILARAYGGELSLGYAHIIGPFGIERPVRSMQLGRPARLAGFTVDRLQVRTADFGGRRTFPEEADRPGDIVVRRRTKAHREWPSVLIGREYLRGCAEILYWTRSRMLSLRCPDTAPTADRS